MSCKAMRYIKVNGLVVVFLLAIFCGNKEKKNNDHVATNDQLVFSDSIESFFRSKGVVTFIPSDVNLKDDIEILNDDGTNYAKINLSKNVLSIEGDNYSLGNLSNIKNFLVKHHFSPKEFYLENFIIQFEFLSTKSDLISIYINKKEGLKKVMRKGKAFKAQSWREHLLGTMIDFDKSKNVIRVDHSDLSKSLNYSESSGDYIFTINEINGDWMKIGCSELCDAPCDEGKKYDGWIRWKNGKNILVKFLYAC